MKKKIQSDVEKKEELQKIQKEVLGEDFPGELMECVSVSRQGVIGEVIQGMLKLDKIKSLSLPQDIQYFVTHNPGDDKNFFIFYLFKADPEKLEVWQAAMNAQDEVCECAGCGDDCTCEDCEESDDEEWEAKDSEVKG